MAFISNILVHRRDFYGQEAKYMEPYRTILRVMAGFKHFVTWEVTFYCIIN